MPNTHDISDIDTSSNTENRDSNNSPERLAIGAPGTIIRPSRLEILPTLPVPINQSTPSTTSAVALTTDKEIVPVNINITEPYKEVLKALPTTDKTLAIFDPNTSPQRQRAVSLSTLQIPAYIEAQAQIEAASTDTTVAVKPDLGVKRKDRSRSVDSPRNSDDDLDTTVSERSPQAKKQDVIDKRKLLKTALVDQYQKILNLQARYYTQVQSLQTKDNERKVKELEKQILTQQEEYTTLQNNLVKAEFAVSNLAKEGLLFEATAEAAIKLAETQSTELFKKLQTTEEEKTKLETEFNNIRKGLVEYYEFNLKQLKEAEKLNTNAFHKALQSKDNQLVSLKADIESKSKEFYAHKEDLEKERKEYQKLIYQQNEEITSLRDDLKNNLFLYSANQTELDRTIAVNQEAEQEITKLQDKIRSLQGELRNVETAYNYGKNKLIEVELRESQLQDKFDNQEIVIANLEDKNQILNREIHRLSTRDPSLEVAYNTFQEQKENYESHIQQLKDLQEQIQDSNRDEQGKLRQALTEAKTDLHKVNLYANQVETDYKKLIDDHSKLQGLYQNLKLKATQLQNTLAINQPTSTTQTAQIVTGQISATMTAQDNFFKAMTSQIMEQSSQEGRREIKTYAGYSAEKSVRSWLKDAEQIADLYSWEDDNRKKFIGTRLKGQALDWHIARLKSNANEDFKEWKAALIAEFEHPADRDKLKIRLNNLKQDKDERTTHFITKIERLYQSIYGEKVPATKVATTNAQEEATKKMREDILLKTFWNGVLPHIKDAMWNGRLNANYDWYDIIKAATESENMLISKQLTQGESFGVNAINLQKEPSDILVLQHEQRIEQLEQRFMNVNLQQGEDSRQTANVAAISNSGYSRTPQKGSVNHSENSRKYSHERRGREHSQEGHRSDYEHRSRPRYRESSYDAKRSNSERRSSSNNRGGYQDSNRFRSESREGRRNGDSQNSKRFRSNSYDRRSRTPSRNRNEQQDNNFQRGNGQGQNYRNSGRSQRSYSPYPKKEVTFENKFCNRCENKGHYASECRTKNPRKFRQSKTE